MATDWIGGRHLNRWVPSPWRGSMTIVAFTESGRIRHLRLPVRLLVASAFLLLVLVIGSTASILLLFRGQVDVARMSYLEGENKSLTALMQGQAEQLSRLKLEVARLREFEQNLRVVSGMDSQAESAGPMVGSGQTRGAKQALPRKR
jgi:hypothetical protein